MPRQFALFADNTVTAARYYETDKTLHTKKLKMIKPQSEP